MTNITEPVSEETEEAEEAESVKILKKLTKFKVDKKKPPFFKSLVKDVSFDVGSGKTLLEYYSAKAEDKDGGRVSILLSNLPSYC